VLPPLETRNYGETGERVTVIGLGGAWIDKYSHTEGVATVRHALELGVTYFDTSPFYCHGVSQAIMGEGLEGRSERYMLATKIGHLAAPARYRSPDALRTQLEENLRLLRRDSVDTLQVHEADWHQWWSDELPREKGTHLKDGHDYAAAPVMEVLRQARLEGLCRFIGITGNTLDDLDRVLRHVDVDTCLTAFNYDLLRRGARRKVLPLARSKKMAVALGSIFHGGRLAGVDREWLASPPGRMTAEQRLHMERLYALQQECGLSLVELAIRYLLADPDFSTALVGAASPAEIEESVTAAQAGPLPDDLHRAVEKLVAT
jgi:aryl-alcohol dehydrogenase-like predicted oxidoreductase